jgi:hypothetical protein
VTVPFDMLTDLWWMNSFYQDHFREKNKKYEHGGRLKVNINILFCWETQ